MAYHNVVGAIGNLELLLDLGDDGLWGLGLLENESQIAVQEFRLNAEMISSLWEFLEGLLDDGRTQSTVCVFLGNPVKTSSSGFARADNDGAVVEFAVDDGACGRSGGQTSLEDEESSTF